MEVSVVKKHIVDKNFDAFYIFTGDELELMWTYIHKICEVSCKQLRYVNDYSKVVKQTRTLSLVKQSFVYVFRDDPVLIKEEKLWDRITDTKTEGNIVIQLVTDMDKRTKFYKKFKDKIVEFEPMKESVLIRYIQSKIAMNETTSKKLVEICEGNYGRILQEIDKISRFCAVTGVSVETCFNRFVHEGIIYQPPRDMIFVFAKQFLLRNSVGTIQLFQECKEGGESALVMLSVLYNNVRQLLQVQTCNSNNVTASTGLTGWQIRNVADAKGKYSGRELVDILHTIHRMETGIKTGEVEEEFAVPYLLVNFL